MEPRPVAIPNGVYRTPGRSPDDARLPRPSLRTLLAPLGRASAFVFFTVAPVVLFNTWIVPTFILKNGEQRLIPTFDFLQNGIALLVAASLAMLVVLIVRRVRPSWRGLGLQSKVAYVTALVFLQSGVVMAAELALFQSRGGLHLFEPRLEKTFAAPDGRTAFLYREGLGCGYDVHVADPYSLTMTRSLHVSRRSCDEPLPALRWKADRGVVLVDANGQPLRSEVTVPLFGWGGGC